MFTVNEFIHQNQEFISSATINIKESIFNTLRNDGYHQDIYTFNRQTPIGAIYILMSELSREFRELGWFLSSQELNVNEVQFKITVRPA